MKILKIFATCAFLYVLGGLAHAQTAAVLPVSGKNVADGTLEAAGDVLGDHLRATGRYQVILVPGPVERNEAAPEVAAGAARSVDADIAVVVHVVRLGNSVKVRLTAYGPDGRLVFVDQMTAASPDDLDVVLSRLAKGLATGRPPGATAALGTVTEKEAAPVLKRGSSHSFGLGLTMAFPTIDNVKAMPGVDLFWLYDARTVLADVKLQFHTNNDSGDASIGIGAYYPFSTGNFTAYLGGGARLEYAQYSTLRGGSGLTLYGAFGLLQGRLGSVLVRAELQYFVQTFSQRFEGVYDYVPGTTSPPDTTEAGHGLIASVGFGF
jgi:hypothetical protein